MLIKDDVSYMAKNGVSYNSLQVPFELKTEDISEDGTFKGWASTFGGPPDSYNDIIVYGAFTETLKKGGRNGNGIAMLYQHNSSQPIGVWTKLEELKKGLKVEGQLVMDVQVAKETHSLMKAGAIKGLSIGYDYARLPDGSRDPDAYEIVEKPKGRYVRYLKKLELWEVSPVTFPANTRATITTVKQFERCKTPRELEDALREAGLSKSSALYIVSLCKHTLRESGGLPRGGDFGNTDAVKLLNALKERNRRFSDF